MPHPFKVPEYAVLLKQLCLAVDAGDVMTCERLFPRARAAHAAYNQERAERGWDPVRIHESSWQGLWNNAHQCAGN
jgi:hypothetical protein